MSLWQKFNTLLRASAEEPVAHLVDANSLRIFAQELRDAEQALANARTQLAVVMAERRQLQRDLTALQQRIAQRETQAKAALHKQEMSLAEALATQVAQDQQQYDRLQQQAAPLTQHEERLKEQLREGVQALKRYRRELSLARANQSAQRALTQLSSASDGLDGSLAGLATTLSTVQARQARAQDQADALAELDAHLSGADLDQRLRTAGIATGKPDAQAVLDRLRRDVGLV